MKILIVIPVYNEEKILAQNISKLTNFCWQNLKIDWQIVIVDNQSTDQTAVIGQNLAKQSRQISYLYLNQKGKGVAIAAGWQKYQADIYCFMDADLATDLSALPLLISEVAAGNAVVVGSRFHQQSQVSRTKLRKIISWFYHWLLKILLNSKINDAACGFKAINQAVKEKVLPLVKNQQWVFDSELILRAEKLGFKIKEVPVVWKDQRPKGSASRVNIFSVSWTYFKALLALRQRLKINQ